MEISDNQRRALRPGGRLVAQCGGGANLERLHARTRGLMSAPQYAACFATWRQPWNFSDAASAARTLRQEGFVEVEASLEPAPTTFADEAAFRSFVERVVLHPVLDAIADPALRGRFMDEIVAWARTDQPPFELDYWRLNLWGRRP